MRKCKLTIAVVLFGLWVPAAVTHAGIISPDNAERIASNWIALTIDRNGDWGGSDAAWVAKVQEFKRQSRILGYYCHIKPQGFILVSILRGLAPVKAYSDKNGFDPLSDEGLSDLMKLRMEAVLNKVEEELGPATGVQSDYIADIIGYDHRSIWAMLDVHPNEFESSNVLTKVRTDYREGEILLSSNWHQGEPYNWSCPPPQPDHPECLLKPHCPVGCVATAAAQITRYWSWPPGRDWIHMPDILDITDPPEQINATTELCRAIGDENDMDYCSYELDGCQSATWDEIEYIELFFQSWAYDDICADVWRIDYGAVDWWNLIIGELAANRPIFYGVRAHVMVCDGYLTQPYYQYHMNYGWSNDVYDAWYAVDNLFQPHPEGGPAYEYMIVGLCPHGYLGSAIAGDYPYNPAYSWRYVDRDCRGTSVHFHAGNLLQFLPFVKMECSATTVRIDGQSGLHSRVFCPDISRGIRIEKGSMVMHPGGGIKFRLSRP
jgi:hypothetical protein